MTLDELAIKNQTDKATAFSRTYAQPHGYTPHMELFFAPMREKEIKLLEIGVGGGESIRTWLEYFPLAKVYGIDLQSGTNPWDTEGLKPDSRYTFTQGDQASEIFWDAFIGIHGQGWHIVIDDGGHFSGPTILTHKKLWPVVAPGGIYCIEDLACSYSQIFLTPGSPSHMAYLQSFVDIIVKGESDISAVHFSKELTILQKKHV